MKFFRNYNMISVPGWHMTAVTVNKETLTEAMGTGVYFLDGKCYFEPTDMTTALRAIWQENAENATEQEAQEAVCFTGPKRTTSRQKNFECARLTRTHKTVPESLFNSRRGNRKT